MDASANSSYPGNIQQSVEVIDLLATQPSQQSFFVRVQNLHLSTNLEQKVHDVCGNNIPSTSASPQLSLLEEKELATEVLLLRHKFTELVWKTRRFNQAALTVIQNIYLFRNRKIFFDPSGPLYEQERQEALHIFSSHKEGESFCPLSNTFQHLVIARVWNRIISQREPSDTYSAELAQLQKIVEQLNTIRNIYVLLTSGLVKKIVSQLGEIYKEGISTEDAWQIGSFGVARAAYRYHHSSGVRFSTYAANWIRKEVQRQTLDGRLIKISTNTIEQYSLARKRNDSKNINLYTDIIKRSSCMQESTSVLCDWDRHSHRDTTSVQEDFYENKEMGKIIRDLVASCLSPKEGDLIKRRFGLSPYTDNQQSIIDISKTYGVTRSSIYQLENKAMNTLKKAIKPSLVYC